MSFVIVSRSRERRESIKGRYMNNVVIVFLHLILIRSVGFPINWRGRGGGGGGGGVVVVEFSQVEVIRKTYMWLLLLRFLNTRDY